MKSRYFTTGHLRTDSAWPTLCNMDVGRTCAYLLFVKITREWPTFWTWKNSTIHILRIYVKRVSNKIQVLHRNSALQSNCLVMQYKRTDFGLRETLYIIYVHFTSRCYSLFRPVPSSNCFSLLLDSFRWFVTLDVFTLTRKWISVCPVLMIVVPDSQPCT